MGRRNTWSKRDLCFQEVAANVRCPNNAPDSSPTSGTNMLKTRLSYDTLTLELTKRRQEFSYMSSFSVPYMSSRRFFENEKITRLRATHIIADASIVNTLTSVIISNHFNYVHDRFN